MRSSAAPARAGVGFYVYSGPGMSLQDLAQQVARALALPLTERSGVCRGRYYRWSGPWGADLLVQANVVDEDGRPVEPEAPATAALLYATHLPDAAVAALAGIGGLRLLSADVVRVPA